MKWESKLSETIQLDLSSDSEKLHMPNILSFAEEEEEKAAQPLLVTLLMGIFLEGLHREHKQLSLSVLELSKSSLTHLPSCRKRPRG